MNRKFAILMSIAMLAGMLTACQQTPENEIVIGKGDVTLEETINDKSDGANTGVYEAPKTLETRAEKNGMTLLVDATVDIPDSEQFSVASVVPQEISQETANKIWDTLIGDTVLYEDREWDYLTKAETEQLIIELQRVIEQSDEPQQKDLDNLAKWQEWYKEAPDTLDLVETSKTFKEIDVEGNIPTMPEGLSEEDQQAFQYEIDMIRASSNTKEIAGTGLDNGFTVELDITDTSASYYKYLGDKGYNVEIREKDDVADMEHLIDYDATISIEQALQDAEAIISNIGLDYFTLSSTLDGYEVVRTEDYEIRKLYPAYSFTFTRALNGVGENAIIYDPTASNDEMYFTPALQNEVVTVTITKDGICYFKWESSSQIKEIISENVELLSFEEVTSILESQLFLSNNSLYIEKLLSSEDVTVEFEDKTIVIDSIQLGMARVKRQGYDNECLVIPVWDFNGHEIAKFDKENAEIVQSFVSDYSFSADGTAENDVYKTYLTINALDGSVIDRTKGY